MRGKVEALSGYGSRGGITPAYAGKSTLVVSSYIEITGSPPPMRGKGPVGRCRSAGHGITPAYAGKRDSDLISAAFTRDHPRLCGEKKVFK